MRTISPVPGRSLAWEEYGDPDGEPVLVFHGTPGCRLLPQRVDDEARRIGVRILAPDRPGFGKSTFVPDRQMADWVADVVALADQGELSSFGLVGYSGGGPYSLLCAQVLPERVSAVACVAGVGPLDTAEARAAMPEATRAFYEAAATGPTGAASTMEAATAAAQSDPDAFAEILVASLPPADGDAVRANRDLGQFMTGMIAEAGADGVAGYAYDFWLLSQPWPFDPAGIKVPVRLFHGDRDVNVPLAHAQHLAAVVPQGSLTVWEGEGHLIGYTRLGEVLKDLLCWSRNSAWS